MEKKREFRDRTDTVRQNLVLSLFQENHTTEEKIIIACNAGVSSPIEMSSLIGVPVDEKLIEKMARIHFQLPDDFTGRSLEDAVKIIKSRDTKDSLK